jgi:predicted HD phosphohydrolase
MTTTRYPARATSLDDVLAVLRADDNHEAQGLTALDHHLQCAALLARAHPEDPELQVAGLLHDIGHWLAPGKPDLHGVVGSEYLRDMFSERVAALVELHVDAKRYLVSVEPGYRAMLSQGSALTLVAQGEAMSADEAGAFEAKNYAADAVVLRRADEMAKVPGLQVPSLAAWAPVLEAAAVRG